MAPHFRAPMRRSPGLDFALGPAAEQRTLWESSLGDPEIAWPCGVAPRMAVRTPRGPRSTPSPWRWTTHRRHANDPGTKRFAEGSLAELLMEVGDTDEVTSDGTLADLVQQWRPIAQVNLSPTTLHEFDRLPEKRILPRFGGTKVRSIRAADILAFNCESPATGKSGRRPARRAEHPPRPRPSPQIGWPTSRGGRDSGQGFDRIIAPCAETFSVFVPPLASLMAVSPRVEGQ
jgi:hypothetical protein